MSTLFPTIGPAECRRYIATGRAQTNAVAEQIREQILQRGTPLSERASRGMGKLEEAPRRLAASFPGLKEGPAHEVTTQIDSPARSSHRAGSALTFAAGSADITKERCQKRAEAGGDNLSIRSLPAKANLVAAHEAK